MFLPPIRIRFPLLPGFSFGQNPKSYPVHNDSHVSYRVLTFKKYEKWGDTSEHTTINSNLIVLFRVLAFYIDLQALPGFWENIARGWEVTDVENTRSIVNFYADRHLDWAKSPGSSTKNMIWRDRLLVHLVGYWCEHRGKAMRQSGPDDAHLFRDMGIAWSYVRDRRRGALFHETGDASLRGIARNVPGLAISHSSSTRRVKTPARRVGQSRESNGTRESRTDPRTKYKSSQSFRGGYTEQRETRGRSRSFSVPRGAHPLDTSFSEPQRSRLPRGVVNEPMTSQQSETSQMMTGGHQQQHEEYIASQPFQVNPSHLGVSQSLDSSCPQSQEFPVIAKSATPAKDTKGTTPKHRTKTTQPKKQVPLSPKRIQKAPTPSPSPSTGSDGDADSEESESESESETEASSVYQDTGSGAEPGVIQRFKRDNIPRKMTRSLTASPSGNSSSSGDSSDSDSASDSTDQVDEISHERVSDNVGESSSGSDSDSDSDGYSGYTSNSSNGSSKDSVSGNGGSSRSNTNEGSSANDSDGSSDDSDGDSDDSEDESDSEPEPRKPLTPKKPVKKPAKTPVTASTRGKKKVRSSNDTREEEDHIKSELDSDSGIPPVPMASISAKDQEPPSSAQRASVPPTTRKEKPKAEIRSAKRRREEDEAEKQTASGRPAAKRRAATQQQSSPSERTKSSKARRRDRNPPVETPCGEESAKAKSRRYKESSPLSEQTFKELPPCGSEHKRSIDMLIQRINALDEKSMRQDKKIRKQDEKIMKQDKKIMRQDEKIIRQDEKIMRQDEKMMK